MQSQSISARGTAKIVPYGSCIQEFNILKTQASFRRRNFPICVRSEASSNEEDDAYYMRRCVELARKAIGRTSPNPMVGCVIVKNGAIVGQGFHPQAGKPHAEVFALGDAGDLTENATAYVSLEPCNHYGRTPPCTEALIRSKVKKVVVGMIDPNPIVSSKGVDKLRNAGIDVIVGVEEDLCRNLNEAYIHQLLTGMPLLTLRYSMSVNGCLIDQIDDGKIDHQGYYLKLLKEHDGLIVSPSLDDEHLQLLYARKPTDPIHISDCSLDKTSYFDEKSIIDDKQTGGINVEKVPLKQMNMNEILKYCKEVGLCSVMMVMNGNVGLLKSLLHEAIEGNLVQKFVIDVLPLWERGGGKLGFLFSSVGRRLMVKDLKLRTSDDGSLLEGYF